MFVRVFRTQKSYFFLYLRRSVARFLAIVRVAIDAGLKILDRFIEYEAMHC